MANHKHPIEIEVVDMGHDINIQDIKHEDNAVTMTREEAEFVYEKLGLILKAESKN
ncbi:hypothetical protein LCGC14_0972430 [marine sediment metagenome]|uniref:Uncharacterized protein n=1 Tax=marine sediment metagenome TaxID=412755 RepID=A0A0F9QUG8_9ZZZZ